ncbi:TonB-dependent receptor plug domain-containing protein [Aurantiacibacter spongiae]|uniref:TonB-dependent receptor n=1 Tax=Aurantiacibacter spongiae TaxID=2488860 RepID=A0A3N5CPV8_9SPHN|nr:TonB-dependent receptor [Aurantiacibacter spongiae]RPF71053.1 TonB-dependent receptor [Aurantiacibacter spongiae]
MRQVFYTLAICLSVPAAAQDDDQTPVIVVLGDGLEETPATPAYATVTLPRERIVTTASGRLEDVLADVAGIQTFRRSDSRASNPTAQGLTLRALGGNATTRTLVLLDGVPLTDPFFGYVPFNAVAPERLASVRVTRGSGSGPFGAGALAGTVELDSADAATLGPLSAQSLVNDRAETQASATLAQSLADGYAVLSGRWDRGRGFYTTPVGERVPATVRARFDSWSVSARLVQPLGSGLEAQLRGLSFRDSRTLRFEGADSTNDGQDISARLIARGSWQADAIVYAQWRNFTNVVISSSSFEPVLNQRDTPSTGLGGKLELRPPIADAHTLRMGLDYRRASGNLEEVNAFSGLRQAGGVNEDAGLFVEDDWVSGDIKLTGGIRLDRSIIRDGYFETIADGRTLYPDRTDWLFSWRGGAVYAASRTVSLRGAVYTGLRQPTLNELYRPYQIFPVTYLANARLKPERLEGYEAGIDWRPAPGASLMLTAFDNRVKDAIANVTIGEDTNQRRNLDAIHARGIEIGGRYARHHFDASASLALTDAEVEGTGLAAALNGLRPAQTPRVAASATLGWRPGPRTAVSATLRHTGAQFEDDLETYLLPAATTLDLFGQIPVTRALILVGRVENLTDEKIITLNRGDQTDLGTPRTVWAGLRYGF